MLREQIVLSGGDFMGSYMCVGPQNVGWTSMMDHVELIQ